MKRLSNLHAHSRYSDGKDSLEEMIQTAIRKGFAAVGISEHAYAPYDTDCCMPLEDVPRYFAEMAQLKEKYAGQIEVYTGLEADSFYDTPKDGLDFVIGSVHYVRPANGEYITVDYLDERFQRAIREVGGGDVRELVRVYYDQVADFAERYRPDIVGHADLITKLNKDKRYFDQQSSWYLDLLEQTADRLAATGCIVEVNTGAISRGYTQVPYPQREMLEMLLSRRVPLILSSDAHSAEHQDFWFPQCEALLREVGCRSAKQLSGGKFVDIEL